MNRTAFTQLLNKYVEGHANVEEAALIDYWYKMLYNHDINLLDTDELAAVEQEMWNKIFDQVAHTKTAALETSRKTWRSFFKYTSAAAIIVGISIGIYNYFLAQQLIPKYQQSKAQFKLNEFVNNTTTTKQIKLQDGSVVVLQPFSKLTYPQHFSTDKREVFLEGEAFFDIVKNPTKPFLVHSANLLTQVLGTSFTIKPNSTTNQIEVSVKTGRVAVFEDDKQVTLNKEKLQNNGTIITPNQKVIYDATNRNFKISLVDNPEPIVLNTDTALGTQLFAFDDEPLSTVFIKISKFYGIDILVENENIYQCKFTGNLSDQSLYDKLSLICQTTNHGYEIKGTNILIKGKGCP
jgi:transmembrane sensor